MWQIEENKPLCLLFLASGAGNQGDRRAFRTAVAWTVGEAMVLTEEGDRPATLSTLVVVEAGTRIEGMRMVAGAEKLAGASATGAELPLADGGAEAWHEGPPKMERAAGLGDPFRDLLGTHHPLKPA